MNKLVIVLFIVMALNLSCTGEKDAGLETLVFGDLTWNSAQVHNRIAAFIIENGIGGYQAEYTSADTLIIVNGLIQGDIDIDMESWHSNLWDVYNKGVESGAIVDLGPNMPDAPQGWWIPRYLVEGDNAVAPNLKSVENLLEYAELFPDPEDPARSVLYAGVSGWGQLAVGEKMFAEFGLEDKFNISAAGSGAALAATLVGAYEKGKPWVGYYWAPTAIMGRLDMVRLKGSEYEPAKVNILINETVQERAPDVVEFLKKYSTTVDENNEFLAKMEDEEWDAEQTAHWFLENKAGLWTQWVDEDVAKKVKNALAEMENAL